MNKITKIFSIFTVYITAVSFVFSNDKSAIYKGLTNIDAEGDIIASDEDKLDLLDRVFKFIKDSIADLTMFIVIAVFLYLGIKLVMAKWNPEELKKVMIHFVYVVIGIFLISAAWALVRLIAGITL